MAATKKTEDTTKVTTTDDGGGAALDPVAEQEDKVAKRNLIISKANLELAELGLPLISSGEGSMSAVDSYNTRGANNAATRARAIEIGERALAQGRQK